MASERKQIDCSQAAYAKKRYFSSAGKLQRHAPDEKTFTSTIKQKLKSNKVCKELD